MRYLILAALLAAQVSSAEYVVAPPRYELPGCGADPVVRWAILPDGTYVHIMRIEQLGPDMWQLVGVDEGRIFCSRMDG